MHYLVFDTSSFICQGTATRRLWMNLFSRQIKLPSVTISQATGS